MPSRKRLIEGGIVVGAAVAAIGGLLLSSGGASGGGGGGGQYLLEVLDYDGNRIFKGYYPSVAAAEAYLTANYGTITTGTSNCSGTEGTAGTWDIFLDSAIQAYGCWKTLS